jgi:hypothetical protein
VPVEVFIVWPACAVPLSCGSAVFDGAVVVVGAAATAAVAAEVALVEPPEFVAVTATRIVDPASVVVRA